MEHDACQLNLEDHKERCRLCLILITDNERVFIIDEAVKKRFENLTSLELSLDNEMLSSIICYSCDRLLKKFNELRDDLKRKQLKLYEYVNSFDQETSEDEVVIEEFIEEDVEPSPEYLSEETFNIDLDNVGDNIANSEVGEEIEESVAQIEFLITDEDEEVSETNHDNLTRLSDLQPVGHKKIIRPRAWVWTNTMERDLIKYYKAFKTDKTSQSSVFEKISRKFEAKNYPKISGKSIKYKYEKLVNDVERLEELEVLASLSPLDTDDECLDYKASERKHKRKITIALKKPLSRWNESKELLLLHLMLKIRCEQPAISDNALFRRIAKEMSLHGYVNITDHNIVYHYKKMKRNEEKFNGMLKKSKELKIQGLQINSTLQEDLEDNIHQKLVSDSPKRSYLHWTETMKKALLQYRSDLEKKTETADLWPSVAKRMEADGYGSFTAQSLFHKYYNLRRDRKKFPYSIDET